MHYARLLRHGDINTNLQKQKKLCSVEGCNNVHRAKGYCAHHYNNYRIYGDPLHKNRIPTYVCTVEGCNQPHIAKGYCRKHYYLFVEKKRR